MAEEGDPENLLFPYHPVAFWFGSYIQTDLPSRNDRVNENGKRSLRRRHVHDLK